VLERVNDNAHKVNVLGDYSVLAIFNVADLSPYLQDDHLVNLRANSFQRGEHDGDLSIVPHSGPQNKSGTPLSSTNPQALVQAILS